MQTLFFTWAQFFSQICFFACHHHHTICFFTQTPFFIKTQICFSLRSVLNSLCFPLRICSSLRLWSSTEFGFFGLVILYLVIFSLLRLSFIQILLFIQTLLFNRFFLQLLIQIKTWVQEKNTSFRESHWFSIDFSLFTWALFSIWTMKITINPDFFYPVRIKRSTAAHAFIHDLQLALN